LIAQALAAALADGSAVRRARRIGARGLDTTAGLARVAASIDDALDLEMLATLRTVGDPGARLRATANGDVAALPLDDALDELWPGVPGAPAPATPAASERAGDLREQDMPLLLGRLFAEGATGRLAVRRDGVEKVVFFEAGRPVCATSTDPTDRMIDLLVREGVVTASQRVAAGRILEETGRKMGAILSELGVIKGEELLPVIRRHFEEIVLSLFSWADGAWRFEPDVMAGAGRTRLLRHPGTLVREGLRRGYSSERLWARLGSPDNVFDLDPLAAHGDVIAEMAGAAEEQRLPALLDGVRSLAQVVEASGLAPDAAVQVLGGLWAFGLLRPALSLLAAAPGRRDRELDRQRIRARLALVHEGDYFQVLGVARDAGLDDIRRAHERLMRDLSTDAVGPQLERELGAELAEIREVLAEALRILSSEPLRARYRGALSETAGRHS
jgi:hypothetical protein